MRHFKLTRHSDGEVSFVCCEDEEATPPGIELGNFAIEEIDHEPNERDSIVGEFRGDPTKAEEWALKQIEDEADKVTGQDVRSLRRQIAIDRLWNEIQRLKIAQVVNAIPSTLTEKRKQFPTLMALVHLTGKTLEEVATATEDRHLNRVRRTSLWVAKMLLARDKVRQAGTLEDKIAEVDVITWTE